MNSNIKIRAWRIEDISSLVQHANNKLISDNLRDAFPYPYTEESARAFIKMAVQKENSKLLYAICIQDKAIGGIGGHLKEDVYRKNAEIGYWLGQKYWGKGIATHCIKNFVGYLFDNYDIERIYAETFENNMASHRVLLKAGFTHEAVLRKNVLKNNILLNTDVYSILKEEYLKLYKN